MCEYLKRITVGILMVVTRVLRVFVGLLQETTKEIFGFISYIEFGVNYVLQLNGIK